MLHIPKGGLRCPMNGRLVWSRETNGPTWDNGKPYRRPESLKSRAAKSGDELHVYCLDEIGPAWSCYGPETLLEDIGEHSGDIVFHVSSPGGDAYAGFAIYSLLRDHPGRVTTRIDSQAEGIASVVAQAGEHRQAAEFATITVQPPATIGYGDSIDFRDIAKALDSAHEAIVGVYGDRTKRERPDVRQWFGQRFSATESVSAGLSDETISNVPAEDLETAGSLAKRQRFAASQRAVARLIDQENCRRLAEACETAPRPQTAEQRQAWLRDRHTALRQLLEG